MGQEHISVRVDRSSILLSSMGKKSMKGLHADERTVERVLGERVKRGGEKRKKNSTRTVTRTRSIDFKTQ